MKYLYSIPMCMSMPKICLRLCLCLCVCQCPCLCICLYLCLHVYRIEMDCTVDEEIEISVIDMVSKLYIMTSLI